MAAGGTFAYGNPAGTSAVAKAYAKVVAKNLSNAETVDQAQAAIYTDFCTWEFGSRQADSTSYFCVTEGGDKAILLFAFDNSDFVKTQQEASTLSVKGLVFGAAGRYIIAAPPEVFEKMGPKA